MEGGEEDEKKSFDFANSVNTVLRVVFLLCQRSVFDPDWKGIEIVASNSTQSPSSSRSFHFRIPRIEYKRITKSVGQIACSPLKKLSRVTPRFQTLRRRLDPILQCRHPIFCLFLLRGQLSRHYAHVNPDQRALYAERLCGTYIHFSSCCYYYLPKFFGPVGYD